MWGSSCGGTVLFLSLKTSLFTEKYPSRIGQGRPFWDPFGIRVLLRDFCGSHCSIPEFCVDNPAFISYIYFIYLIYFTLFSAKSQLLQPVTKIRQRVPTSQSSEELRWLEEQRDQLAKPHHQISKNSFEHRAAKGAPKQLPILGLTKPYLGGPPGPLSRRVNFGSTAPLVCDS